MIFIVTFLLFNIYLSLIIGYWSHPFGIVLIAFCGIILCLFFDDSNTFLVQYLIVIETTIYFILFILSIQQYCSILILIIILGLTPFHIWNLNVLLNANTIILIYVLGVSNLFPFILLIHLNIDNMIILMIIFISVIYMLINQSHVLTLILLSSGLTISWLYMFSNVSAVIPLTILIIYVTLITLQCLSNVTNTNLSINPSIGILLIIWGLNILPISWFILNIYWISSIYSTIIIFILIIIVCISTYPYFSIISYLYTIITYNENFIPLSITIMSIIFLF